MRYHSPDVPSLTIPPLRFADEIAACTCSKQPGLDQDIPDPHLFMYYRPVKEWRLIRDRDGTLARPLCQTR